MNRQLRYIVTQDGSKQVFEGSNEKECHDYLNLVIEDYPNLIHRLNEKDGTLTLQDPETGTLLTTLRIKVVDISAGSRGVYDGINLASLFTKTPSNRRGF